LEPTQIMRAKHEMKPKCGMRVTLEMKPTAIMRAKHSLKPKEKLRSLKFPCLFREYLMSDRDDDPEQNRRIKL